MKHDGKYHPTVTGKLTDRHDHTVRATPLTEMIFNQSSQTRLPIPLLWKKAFEKLGKYAKKKWPKKY